MMRGGKEGNNVTVGENPGRRLRTGRTLLALARAFGGAIAIVVLFALVPLLAGVRTDFDPWRTVSPAYADGGPIIGVALAALLSALGSGIGLMAIVGIAVLALAAAGRRYDAAFVADAVFGAVILSLPLKSYFGSVRPPAPDSVSNWIHYADVAVALVVGAGILAALLTRWRRWVVAAVVIALAAFALETLIATFIPLTAGFDAFPSGHSMYSMTLAASVVPLAWHSPRTRYPVLAASMLYVLGVGVSRVYLHAHIPADIVAGWCAALAWTAGFRILWVTVAPAILQASRAGNDLDLHPLA